MGYALFAQRKIVLDAQLNSLELQQSQRSDEQYQLATDSLSLSQQMTSMQAAQSSELSDLYEQLSETTDETGRSSINDLITTKEEEFDAELDSINNEIYLVSVKEESLELEVKRLDTQVTAVQSQLEAVEDAESGAIDRATPSYGGLG